MMGILVVKGLRIPGRERFLKVFSRNLEFYKTLIGTEFQLCQMNAE